MREVFGVTCMKCGVEIPEGQVFCDSCLAVMEQYPVKPGTRVHLPKRAEETELQKKATKKKRMPTPEEQISALKLKVLRTRLAAVILAFLLCIVSALLGLKLYQEYFVPTAGRNYTVDTSIND